MYLLVLNSHEMKNKHNRLSNCRIQIPKLIIIINKNIVAVQSWQGIVYSQTITFFYRYVQYVYEYTLKFHCYSEYSNIFNFALFLIQPFLIQGYAVIDWVLGAFIGHVYCTFRISTGRVILLHTASCLFKKLLAM